MPDQQPGAVPTVRPTRWRGEERPRVPATERIGRFARAFLAIMAGGFLVVLGVAAWLHPYTADGAPLSQATHTQLGLPPCNMMVMYGKPCPSCGMTTSFALLAHADVGNSLRANWVGTLLAVFWLGLIPWGLYGAVRGRLLWVRNGELFLTVAVGVILALLLVRWAWVLVF